MKQYTLFVKERLQSFSLLKDIFSTAKNTVHHLGRGLSWLKFAQPTTYGYILLPDKDEQYETLKGICGEVRSLHPEHTHGKIADTISVLVNTTVQDCLEIRSVSRNEPQDETEQQFLNTQLITASVAESYVPRYPWFMVTEKTENNRWRAKDLVSNSMVTIQKFQDVNFYKYTITYA